MLLMPKRALGEKFKTEQVNLRMSNALLDRLDRIGEPLGIKRSQLIHQAVVDFVLRHEASQQQQPKPAR
jgi:predicted transcriptional regulator